MNTSKLDQFFEDMAETDIDLAFLINEYTDEGQRKMESLIEKSIPWKQFQGTEDSAASFKAREWMFNYLIEKYGYNPKLHDIDFIEFFKHASALEEDALFGVLPNDVPAAHTDEHYEESVKILKWIAEETKEVINIIIFHAAHTIYDWIQTTRIDILKILNEEYAHRDERQQEFDAEYWCEMKIADYLTQKLGMGEVNFGSV